jgi:hypothetical protein
VRRLADAVGGTGDATGSDALSDMRVVQLGIIDAELECVDHDPAGPVTEPRFGDPQRLRTRGEHG